MTTATIDNALGDDFGRVVLWQYDKAYNFLRILDVLSSWFLVSVTQFWNAYLERMVAIDTADAFGLKMWGVILGQDRPNYAVYSTENGEDSHPVPVSDDMYRRILKARFFLMNAPGSIEDYSRAVNMVFPASDGVSRCVRVVEDDVCAMHYEKDSAKWDLLDEESRLVFRTAHIDKYEDGLTDADVRENRILNDAHYDSCRALLVYPAGVRRNVEVEVVAFGFDGQEPQDEEVDLKVGGFCEAGVDPQYFHSTIFMSSDVPDTWPDNSEPKIVT